RARARSRVRLRAAGRREYAWLHSFPPRAMSGAANPRTPGAMTNVFRPAEPCNGIVLARLAARVQARSEPEPDLAADGAGARSPADRRRSGDGDRLAPVGALWAARLPGCGTPEGV